MNVQFRRVTAGFYTATALGYKIRLRKIKDQGGYHWEADSPDSKFPPITDFRKAAVIRKVNEHLEGMIQR